MELKTQCRERFKPAVDAINEIIKQEDNTDRPILVAIDGRCGSGKTTLGEYLKGSLIVICFIWMTSFYAWNSVHRTE